ncbi:MULTISPECIES: hypothetical protein [Thermoanaerobacterium]|uniref:Uncharacterized protein n=2 Tax=Thermoanaerobacterium TaxID=28895 RepID=W9E7F0_9THEO|nr:MULTISPECIES: hypothetical protein [Thermoanaerobacterium]AFK86303.1 hypothetical protein Tsac_1292 [Thermoanaerobacterium saccharolyticum JW/SL-YS485]ETO37353.1 hypothetical protein V518_2421 [Thermoanaerobacterium aotearoense SCUT27]
MEEMKKKFEEASKVLRQTVDISFTEYSKDKSTKNEIVKLWQLTINDFLQYAVKMSEKHQAKELYKSIARALIFGK